MTVRCVACEIVMLILESTGKKVMIEWGNAFDSRRDAVEEVKYIGEGNTFDSISFFVFF